MAEGDRVVVAPPVLEVEAVEKAFGGVHALRGVSFSVPERSITAIIGPNGSGKSTLFDVITGYQRAHAGRIRFRGADVGRLPPHEISRRGLVRTFQLTRVFPNMTVLENMLVCGGRLPARDVAKRADELLSFVRLEAFADRAALGLSYGQQKLLELAQVLMLDPAVLLLDEPMAGVNPALIDQIADLVRTMRESGKTFVLIEHNLAVVSSLCDQLVVINAGQVLSVGDPNVVLEEPRVREAFLGT